MAGLTVLSAMRFAFPKHSSGDVDRAGESLIQWDGDSDDKSIDEALDILYDWRRSHGYPLSVFQHTLRKKAREVDSRALVAQRHKRILSIFVKLRRFEGQFPLSEMQDIAGCRAVVSSAKKVQELVEKYETSRIRHKLLYKNDYIKRPKTSGYRSIHLIFGFHSETYSQFDDYRIEMQFRSRRQHAWATAVETVDAFRGQSLKAGKGEYHWKRFFALMGSYFGAQGTMRPCTTHP